MILLHKDEMPRLPTEAKNLIREGIYSLYTIRGNPDLYVLSSGSSRHLYFLNRQGEIVQGSGYDIIADIPLEDVVTFEDDEYIRAIRINA